MKISPRREWGCPSSCVCVWMNTSTLNHLLDLLNVWRHVGGFWSRPHHLFGSAAEHKGRDWGGSPARNGTALGWGGAWTWWCGRERQKRNVTNCCSVQRKESMGNYGKQWRKDMVGVFFVLFCIFLNESSGGKKSNALHCRAMWSKTACAVFHEDVALCVRMSRGGRIVIGVIRSVEIRISSG